MSLFLRRSSLQLIKSRNISKQLCKSTHYEGRIKHFHIYATQRSLTQSLTNIKAIPTVRYLSKTNDTLISRLSENEFIGLTDEIFEEIVDLLEGIEVMIEDCDIQFSQGVLTIDLGDYGTWVLNRQVPNRQIWWSSPISGPRRYEYKSDTRKWINTRDGGDLMELLMDELDETTGITIHK